MTDHEKTREELEEQNGEPLPDREVMSLINPVGDADVAFDTPKDLDYNPAPPQGTD